MGNITPIDEEYELEGEGALVYQMDMEGILTYANRRFRQASMYEYDELVGHPESILHHPDMPKAAYKKMWDTIKSAQVFNGTVKLLRKDGRYFWVNLEILPVKEEKTGQIDNFMAVARPASRKDIEENEELYRRMLEAEQRGEEEI